MAETLLAVPNYQKTFSELKQNKIALDTHKALELVDKATKVNEDFATKAQLGGKGKKGGGKGDSQKGSGKGKEQGKGRKFTGAWGEELKGKQKKLAYAEQQKSKRQEWKDGEKEHWTPKWGYSNWQK